MRVKTILLAAGLACAAAAFAETFAIDGAVPATGAFQRAYERSDKGAAKLIEVRFAGTGSSGTASVSAIHTGATGAVSTNAVLSAATTTNAVVAASPWILPGDTIRVQFSAATNGCFTLVLQR